VAGVAEMGDLKRMAQKYPGMDIMHEIRISDSFAVLTIAP
jgi:hypothetical protein